MKSEIKLINFTGESTNAFDAAGWLKRAVSKRCKFKTAWVKALVCSRACKFYISHAVLAFNTVFSCAFF